MSEFQKTATDDGMQPQNGEPLTCEHCGRYIPRPMAHYAGMGERFCAPYASGQDKAICDQMDAKVRQDYGL